MFFSKFQNSPHFWAIFSLVVLFLGGSSLVSCVMLFSSFAFICAFLPVVVAGYFTLARVRPQWLMGWLTLASLFFYGFWKWEYVPLILLSVGVNYALSVQLQGAKKKWPLLTLGILFNVGLLGFFKYVDFFLENYFAVTGATDGQLLGVILPLGISFFTFQQIAYLVDAAQGKVEEFSWLRYTTFVTFFPQLIAGPIVHHAGMMPQFATPENQRVNWHNIALGVTIFAFGLGKKILIADNLSPEVAAGFADVGALSVLEAWQTALAYAGQLYFDFSGYTDMAIGAALLLNVRLPFNFNQPYTATSLQDFWRRWHMTLTQFLTEYIYFPLGGSRKGVIRTYLNIFLVFLISGFWHGAGWTFVLWGVAHGVWMMLERVVKRWVTVPDVLGWAVTMLFVLSSWVVFRAPDLATAQTMLLKMWTPELSWETVMGVGSGLGLTYIIGKIALDAPQIWERFKPNFWWGVSTIALFVASMISLNKATEFLYFQF